MRIAISSPKTWLIILFFCVILGYSLFQARFIILGPQLQIISPQNGATLDNGMVNVVGHVENISFISLNDRPIYVDEKGDFNEKLIAPQGLSIMTLLAKDRFGRSTERQIEIFVK